MILFSRPRLKKPNVRIFHARPAGQGRCYDFFSELVLGALLVFFTRGGVSFFHAGQESSIIDMF